MKNVVIDSNKEEYYWKNNGMNFNRTKPILFSFVKNKTRLFTTGSFERRWHINRRRCHYQYMEKYDKLLGEVSREGIHVKVINESRRSRYTHKREFWRML